MAVPTVRKPWSVVSFLVIALLAVASAVCAKGVFESLLARQVDAWLSDQPTLFTSQLTDG